MGKWFAAVAAVVLATGCKFGASAFHCDEQHLCGPGGTCEPGFGLCSFPDDKCGPDGRSFGDLSGDQSGMCVSGVPPGEAGVDTPSPPPPVDALACYGTKLLHICFAAPPTMPLMISEGLTIDTDNPSMCAATVSGASNYCVLVATSITVDATLTAKGTKPLVLIASDSITVSQLIDVGSHRTTPEFIGAGADPATCVAGTPAGTRGGGAGGSFTGTGGTGGSGANGGPGGQPATPTTTITELRGGCPGQNGDGGGKGAGGHGGGAVYLIAVNRIDITGPGINAAGEGGDSGKGGPAAAPISSGAGGGGAGGMIGFDAPTITCTSLLLASGGSGGEGSGVTTDGAPGEDPSTTAAATGGAGKSTIGGDGGNGSPSAAPGAGGNGKNGMSANVMGTITDGGGGAGGGGAGLIKGPAGSLGNNISPKATP